MTYRENAKPAAVDPDVLEYGGIRLVHVDEDGEFGKVTVWVEDTRRPWWLLGPRRGPRLRKFNESAGQLREGLSLADGYVPDAAALLLSRWVGDGE